MGETFFGTNRVVQFRVDRLSEMVDPFREKRWQVSPAMVDRCIEEFHMISTSHTSVQEEQLWTPEKHAARIAFLVEYPSGDPIDLNVMQDSIDILDGNHRLAAAIYRKDPWIWVSPISDDESLIQKYIWQPPSLKS